MAALERGAGAGRWRGDGRRTDDEAAGDLVRHDLSVLDVVVDHVGLRAALLPLGAQQVTRGQVHEAVVLDELLAHRALASAGAAEHENNQGLRLAGRALRLRGRGRERHPRRRADGRGAGGERGAQPTASDGRAAGGRGRRPPESEGDAAAEHHSALRKQVVGDRRPAPAAVCFAAARRSSAAQQRE